jgi:hypothetical protein
MTNKLTLYIKLKNDNFIIANNKHNLLKH